MGSVAQMNHRPDPILYCNLECFLLDEVGPRFRKEGSIGAFDFFSIIVWKSNRSKSKVAIRLRAVSKQKSLERICLTISKAIWNAREEKDKMRVLVSDWKFRLPIASAILTVLYPAIFTVYDYRVADQVGEGGKLVQKTKFEDIWSGYIEFRKKVREIPHGNNLRQKDHYLFGKSRMEDLIHDIKHGFL